ncbi:MAG: hypothetical protein ALECFALPRED_001411 [Alectoria fallacina]|uniref:Uncharacterized protein n=1 Tax=Alectoria fallacina TaxID=1903189 RepID=A0A8H3FDI5_9LECA|nr:MAG: hypothetical protein ALECFALPRED_001411 [Alectoria fallacina]
MEGLDAGPLTASDIAQLQLTSLTPELKCAIFTNLPDVTSAKSLALASSSFYYTFLDAQALILTQVLQNEISTPLLHGAFAAYKASRIPVWSKQAIQDFLNEYFGDSVPHKSQKWKLSEALHMSRIHSCVEFFTAEFASFALSKNPTARGSNAAPSFTEIIRIKRILYRFELYCNLFRKPIHDRMIRGQRNCLIQPSPFEKQEQRGIFFDRFSPWENEQLGCIHDYLIEEITVAFNDVAEHDVDWGELSIAWVDTSGNGEDFYKEGFLLKGLDFIFQLSTARIYDDRHSLLELSQNSGGSYLFEALGPPRLLQYGGVPLEEYNEEEEKLYVRSPFDDDDDIGPAEAWRRVHAKSTKGRFYYVEDHCLFRRRGYVMWDLSRLLGWNFLSLPVQALASERLSGYLEHLEKKAEREKQEVSWTERSRIWSEGGRGWWAPGD